jgi:rubrerythrin
MAMTKKYLKESIKNEKAANKSYLKHSKGKGNKFLKEIAKDERHHRKILTRKLKQLDKKKPRKSK